jgi:hypothetical protein
MCSPRWRRQCFWAANRNSGASDRQENSVMVGFGSVRGGSPLSSFPASNAEGSPYLCASEQEVRMAHDDYQPETFGAGMASCPRDREQRHPWDQL